MKTLYRSRQYSWAAMAAILLVLGLAAVLGLSDPRDAPPWWFFVVVPAVVAAFSTMTVTVDRESLRIAFLLGFPRRTVPVADIVSCEPYRATGLQRLTTGVKPMQGRYQMSGGGGVVVARRQGMPITLSDPDPEKLARAVAEARERHSRIHGG